MPTPGRLLTILAASIGREGANLELRWMNLALQQGLPSHVPKADLAMMVARRVRGEPLQYILGTQPFGPLNLLTRPPVLIPRPETEHWTIRLSEIVSPSAQKPISVLDLCTGSGCIPLLLCRLWPPGSVQAVGVDISTDAIQLSRDNATVCNISTDPSSDGSQRNVFTPVLADIFDPAFLHSPTLRPPFDIITSNPPYISKKEYDELSSSVRDFEDPRALLGDPPNVHSDDHLGLMFYRRIAQLIADKSRPLLKPGGLVLLEIGEKQAEDVKNILRTVGGIRDLNVWLDPWEKQRVVFGRL